MISTDGVPHFAEMREIWNEFQGVYGPEEPGRPPTDAPATKVEELTEVAKLADALLTLLRMEPEPENILECAEMQEINALKESVAAKGKQDAVLSRLGFELREGSWEHAEKNHTTISAIKEFAEFKSGASKGDPDEGIICFPKSETDEDIEKIISEEVDLAIDTLITQILEQQKLPSFPEMVTICQRARRRLAEEENILTIDPPCTVVGDIHGQFDDLTKQVLKEGGDPSTTKYVFLGDFVDRGNDSLLCMALILLYKLKNPDQVLILRGNHESRITNTIYGFHDECRKKYSEPDHLGPQSQYSGKPESKIWTLYNHLFDALPLAALIGGKVFCCHGGLSPLVKYPHQVLCFNRFQDIMPRGLMADLTWSDPGQQKGFQPNVRGSGCLFGPDEAEKFCERNGLKFVCRAHQCVKEGWKEDQNGRTITVFSAPNYCFAENKGAIMLLDKDMNYTCVSYDHTPSASTGDAFNPNHYFKDEEEDDDDGPEPESPTDEQDDDDGPKPAVDTE